MGLGSLVGADEPSELVATDELAHSKLSRLGGGNMSTSQHLGGHVPSAPSSRTATGAEA